MGVRASDPRKSPAKWAHGLPDARASRVPPPRRGRVGGRPAIAYRRPMSRIAALALLLLLAACAAAVDTEQLRVCRLVLPALHPGDSEIREVRSLPAVLGTQGVRLDYTAREPGETQAQAHFATCGFDGTL